MWIYLFHSPRFSLWSFTFLSLEPTEPKTLNRWHHLTRLICSNKNSYGVERDLEPDSVCAEEASSKEDKMERRQVIEKEEMFTDSTKKNRKGGRCGLKENRKQWTKMQRTKSVFPSPQKKWDSLPTLIQMSNPVSHTIPCSVLWENISLSLNSSFYQRYIIV